MNKYLIRTTAATLGIWVAPTERNDIEASERLLSLTFLAIRKAGSGKKLLEDLATTMNYPENHLYATESHNTTVQLEERPFIKCSLTNLVTCRR